MIYPGLFSDFSKAGYNNFTIFKFLSNNWLSTAFRIDGICSFVAISERIAKLWEIKSILHSKLSLEPNFSPLSKNALK